MNICIQNYLILYAQNKTIVRNKRFIIRKFLLKFILSMFMFVKKNQCFQNV